MRHNATRFRGLIAAPHTAFRPDLSVNLDAVEDQARHFLRSGVSALFICGSTGEGPSLSQEERRQLARRWTEVVRGTVLPVMVHVGSNCLPDAQALAAHAQSCGAHAISAMAPFYYKPGAVDDLVEYCAAIAAAAPEVPFYFYDYPGMTGVRLRMADFLESAAERIPSFAGLKHSSGDLTQVQACLHAADGTLNILLGCDELLLAGWALGVPGAVGTTFNVAAPLYLQIIEAFEHGDFAAARRKQFEAASMVERLARRGLVASSKAVMKMLGVDCGPVRPPLRTLTSPQLKSLRKDLSGMTCFRRLR